MDGIQGMAGGTFRLRSFLVPDLKGVFLGRGQSAVAFAPLELADGSVLNVLNLNRKFMIRVNCTDPGENTRHCFIQRSDGNLVYRNAFASEAEMN